MLKQKQWPSIQDLNWLEIFDQCIDHPTVLPNRLESLGVTVSILKTLAAPRPVSGEPYSRKILFKSKDMEVMIANWSMKTVSSPHNHGASRGLIWFVDGSFAEQNFIFRNQDLVHVDDSVLYKENSVVKVVSSDIHSCGPESEGISLHLYSPPINKMKVWDCDQRRTLTVADDCGAWVPSNSQLILSSVNW